MDSPQFPRTVCLTLATMAILAGGLGMAARFHSLASSGMVNIISGTAGFVAGSALIAGGLVSMTLVATRPGLPDGEGRGYSELD